MKGLSMFMSYDEYEPTKGLQRIKDNEMTRVSFDRSKQLLQEDETDAFEVLCQALCTNTSVTHLRISYNAVLTEKPIQSLVEMLRFNTSVESLTILLSPENNILNVEQMSAIASGLEGNSTLLEFSLENCLLNAALIEALMRGIGPNITSLGLSSNRIDDAQTIATFLQTNSTLKILELWDNQIGEQGALQLWQALALNITLEVLSVKNNGISGELERKLMLQVESNRSEKPLKSKKKKKQAAVASRKNVDTNSEDDNSNALADRVASLEESHTEQAKVIADLQQKLVAQSELFQKLGMIFSPSVAATKTSASASRKKRKVKS
jgi:hypothetical protein